MPPRFSSIGPLSITLTTLMVLTAPTAQAQGRKRDHLTPQESEVVQLNQELDKRISVFIKAIERRFAAINGTAMEIPKQKLKDGDVEDWGNAPNGTRAELLGDIAGLLEEAITNIDNVGIRDPKNSLIGSSLRKLAGATKGFAAQLEALRTKSQDADELSAIQHAWESCQEILEASGKAPAPPPEAPAKKKP